MPAERPAPNTTPATASRARSPRVRTIALLLAAAVVAGGGYYYWQRSASDGAADRPLLATATYGDVENTVASAGNLQPSNTVPVTTPGPTKPAALDSAANAAMVGHAFTVVG